MVAVLVALALVLLVPLLVDQLRQLATTLPDEMRAAARQSVEEVARSWLGSNFPAFQGRARPR